MNVCSICGKESNSKYEIEQCHNKEKHEQRLKEKQANCKHVFEFKLNGVYTGDDFFAQDEAFFAQEICKECGLISKSVEIEPWDLPSNIVELIYNYKKEKGKK